MRKSQKIRRIALVTLLLVGSVSATIAQSAALNPNRSITTEIPDLKEQIEVTLSPEYPKPNELVSITVEAYGFDLDNSLITWRVDGAVAQEKKGAKTFSLRAKKAGSQTKISLTIAPPNGKVLERSFTINPQSVDIIWEARSYTPPFYRGKGLYTPQEEVVLAAMPDFFNQSGQAISPSTVVYKWSHDTETEGIASGYNAQSYSFIGSIFTDTSTIGVQATAGDLAATHYINLTPTDSEMHLYEKHDLYGILWNKAISEVTDFGDKKEKTLQAVPYFFDTDTLGDVRLAFDWSLNGRSINVSKFQNAVTFRNTDDLEGKAIVGSSIGNVLNVLQEASARTTIEFDKSETLFSF